MSDDFTVWQLSDSAFPSSGFMHSSGLEAAWQHGEVRSPADLMEFAATALAQLGHSQLPFAIAAFHEPGRIDEWNGLLDAMLSNHVANRASRRQGQALLASAAAAFERTSVARFREEDGAHRPCHFAVVFGAVCAQLRLDEPTTSKLLLFVTLRGIISAAVRLGIVGPLEGQQIQHRLGANAVQIADRAPQCDVAAAAQTAPTIDIVQATHDRLYSRLFQS